MPIEKEIRKMEENKENVINAEELKSEASNTVNQVKETMKNVNIKEETKVAKIL